MFKLAPSILSADFAHLGNEITQVIKAGADWIHFDVMDNHYVPNLTIGPMVCQAIKPYTKSIPIDVHLMVEPVDSMIQSFIQAGADIITFHPEASKHIDRSLSLIRSAGLKAGLVLNPATPIGIIDHVMDQLDIILLMSVNPGFGGQSFIPHTINKIKEVKARCESYQKYNNRKILIEVDGGIKVDNIKEIALAGADIFVAGSAIFGQDDYIEVFKQFRKELATIG